MVEKRFKEKINFEEDTKIEMEFKEEFGNIERIERLCLPSWKWLNKFLKSNHIKDEFISGYHIAVFDGVVFNYQKNANEETFVVYYNNGSKRYNFDFGNYIEACKFVKKLFLNQDKKLTI